jgi:anti-sigma regulatory factor (Ser/Thr protein kinase)
VLIYSEATRSSGSYNPGRILDEYNRPLPPPPPAGAQLDFDATKLVEARHFTLNHARAAGLAHERLDDLELAINEAITNSVIHGGGNGTLTVWADADHLLCQVHDSGHITDPLASRIPAAVDQLGGRGLLLINHVADLVRLHTGTTLRLHFIR